jgi:hypothetical protein
MKCEISHRFHCHINEHRLPAQFRVFPGTDRP